MKLTRLIQTCLLMLGLFVATAALAAKPESSDEAKQHFSAGMAYLADPSGPKLEEAYREFRTAYDLQPSYRILSNIGYCALHLERDAAVIEAYKGFLAEATASDMTPRQRKQMETDVQMLSAGLVTITLKTAPDNVTITDERFSSSGPVRVNRYPVAGGNSQLGIHPGSHKFTATADGYASQTWEFEADPASKHNHEFKLVPIGPAKAAQPAATAATAVSTQPPNSASQPPVHQGRETPTSVYVGGAITGVLVVAATVMGLMAVSKKSDYDQVNKNGLRPQEAQSLHDDAKRYALFADIGLGAAVLAAGITTYLYLSEPQHSSVAPTSRASIRLSPSVGASQGGLTVSGQF